MEQDLLSTKRVRALIFTFQLKSGRSLMLCGRVEYAILSCLNFLLKFSYKRFFVHTKLPCHDSDA